MPTYDRPALVEEIRVQLAGRAELVPWEAPDTLMTLVVSGCPNACADIRALGRKPVFILREPAEAADLIKIIKSERIDELAERL